MLARARIYIFPDPGDAARRLTLRDRLDLHDWGRRIEGAGLRLVLGRDSSVLSHDFVQLHRGADLAWTIVRQGRSVRVWHGSWGPDLGTFPAMADAIAATLADGGAGTGKACQRRRRVPSRDLPHVPARVHRIGAQPSPARGD